ncbi:sulfatase-like hydrolase/transferase [Verrucomicrobiales bacterium]|nr:sulfatase-like hydrolase/transferase [Verrucomicrobiales bacterium]
MIRLTKGNLASTFVFLILLTFTSTRFALAEKPNVIFVFSDDHRFDSMGMTGDPVTETPHLDQLAAEGVFFNNAYITSPICGPSRANIFTGQWERKNRIGFTYVSQNSVSAEAFENSFLMQMKHAGYSTAFLGKHHTKIVDRSNTPLKENIDFCYYEEGHLGFYPAKKHKAFTNLKNKTQVEGLFEATEAYLSPGEDFDCFYDNADKSLKGRLDRRDPDKPFCAWINFNLPHQASLGGMGSQPDDPDFYSKRYADRVDQLPLPAGYPVKATLPEDVLTVSEMEPYYRLKDRALLDTKLKTARAVFAIDQFMGNLRLLLERLNEDDNTIIIFASDNGLLYGEHGIGGKTMLYEESAHVPLLVYSPFLPESNRGASLDELAVGQDIPATILDLCGIEVPATYQGASLLPLMEGREEDWRTDVFLENLFTDQGYPRHDAVRSEQYKYIRYFSRENDRKQYLPDGIAGEEPIYEELFDLKNDPTEQVNLAENHAFAEVLKAHRERCRELASELSQ